MRFIIFNLESKFPRLRKGANNHHDRIESYLAVLLSG